MPSRYLTMITILVVILPILIVTNTAYCTVREYKVGIVPQFEQRKLYRIWRPILDRLEKLAGLKLTLVGTSKISEFEKHLVAGKFDIAYMNPYHLLQGNSSQGYLPVIHDGNRKLKGILVVHKESGITNPRQLDGKIVAFPSPNALGASLLLRAELSRIFNIKIQPKYVKTHSSVYLHVAKHLVTAGGGIKRTLTAQNDIIRSELRIIHETQGVAPHPIAFHPRMPATDREKLLSAILKMGDNPNDCKLLDNIPMTKVKKTSLADYKSLTELGLKAFYIQQ